MAADPLSATFAALADPTRRAILARLVDGEATVTELARPFRMSLPAVSKHLRVLQDAGLVVQGRRAQWRPCRLEPEPLHAASDWMETYRELWAGRIARIDALLAELRQQEEPPHDALRLAPRPTRRRRAAGPVRRPGDRPG